MKKIFLCVMCAAALASLWSVAYMFVNQINTMYVAAGTITTGFFAIVAGILGAEYLPSGAGTGTYQGRNEDY